MAQQIVGNAWANVVGRRVASLTTVVVVASLMAAVVALLIPVRGLRDNLRAFYDRDTWKTTFFVQGIAGADHPLNAAEVAQLGAEPGVTGIARVDGVSADLAGESVQVMTYVDGLDVALASGRAPRPGACEAVVTRSVPGARTGDVIHPRPTPESGSAVPVVTRVVGVIDQSYPLVQGPTVLTTCPLHTDASGEVVVATTDGHLPLKYIAATLDATAKSTMVSTSTTGVLGLLTLAASVIAVLVVGSVARWGVRARLGEFTTLRVWGRSKSSILAIVGVEQGVLAFAAAPLGVGLGTLLGWRLVCAAGPSGLVDPEAAITIALPSWSTIGIAAGGFTVALVALTVLPVTRTLAPDVARLLRRRGE